MRLSSDQFRNKHGDGAAKLLTVAASREQIEFATTIGGDFTVNQPKRFPAMWRFSTTGAAIAFKLRFSEEAQKHG